jgi:hypothetical protein
MSNPEVTEQLTALDRLQTIALCTAVVAIGGGVEMVQVADVASSAEKIVEVLSWAAIGSGVAGATARYASNRIRARYGMHNPSDI